MIIPQHFQTAIGDFFYDKDIYLYTANLFTDSSGFKKRTKNTLTKTFKANVRFDNLDLIQREQGLDEVINVAISTHDTVPIISILEYDNISYKIIKNIKYDSHYLILARKI